ncbi:MAG: hypothetical protein AAGA60_27580 [Cyanobacteria bacterium P01_E01_bin.42]
MWVIEERGLQEAYHIAKTILNRRLQKPSPEVQECLLDAVERDIAARKRSSDPTPIAVKLDVRQVVLEVLTSEDWQEIERSAIASK